MWPQRGMLCVPVAERYFVRSAAQQFLLVNKILNFILKIDLFAGQTMLE